IIKDLPSYCDDDSDIEPIKREDTPILFETNCGSTSESEDDENTDNESVIDVSNVGKDIDITPRLQNHLEEIYIHR
ncbi:hypothetical protein NPIL_155091, partial [Nephila pilipes]